MGMLRKDVLGRQLYFCLVFLLRFKCLLYIFIILICLALKIVYYNRDNVLILIITNAIVSLLRKKNVRQDLNPYPATCESNVKIMH